MCSSNQVRQIFVLCSSLACVRPSAMLQRCINSLSFCCNMDLPHVISAHHVPTCRSFTISIIIAHGFSDCHPTFNRLLSFCGGYEGKERRKQLQHCILFMWLATGSGAPTLIKIPVVCTRPTLLSLWRMRLPHARNLGSGDQTNISPWTTWISFSTMMSLSPFIQLASLYTDNCTTTHNIAPSYKQTWSSGMPNTPERYWINAPNILIFSPFSAALEEFGQLPLPSLYWLRNSRPFQQLPVECEGSDTGNYTVECRNAHYEVKTWAWLQNTRRRRSGVWAAIQQGGRRYYSKKISKTSAIGSVYSLKSNIYKHSHSCLKKRMDNKEQQTKPFAIVQRFHCVAIDLALPPDSILMKLVQYCHITKVRVAKWTLPMHQSCLECLVLESEEGPDLTSPFTSCESLCL